MHVTYMPTYTVPHTQGTTYSTSSNTGIPFNRSESRDWFSLLRVKRNDHYLIGTVLAKISHTEHGGSEERHLCGTNRFSCIWWVLDDLGGERGGRYCGLLQIWTPKLRCREKIKIKMQIKILLCRTMFSSISISSGFPDFFFFLRLLFLHVISA